MTVPLACSNRPSRTYPANVRDTAVAVTCARDYPVNLHDAAPILTGNT